MCEVPKMITAQQELVVLIFNTFVYNTLGKDSDCCYSLIDIMLTGVHPRLKLWKY